MPSPSHSLRKSLRTLPLLLLWVAASQCTKVKSTDIGADLLPVADNIRTFDTSISVIAENFLFGDSAVPLIGKNFQGKAMEHILGHVSSDPLFGKTTASIFMELKPSSYKYYFENVPDSMALDSVVLCLSWNRTWGDTNANQRIQVFEAFNTIRTDTSYNTNVNFRVRTLLGARTFPPSILDDSVRLAKQTLARQLRIRLTEEFGRRLLSLDSADGKPYSSDSAFRDYFRGFALLPDEGLQGANALMGFALSDTNTHLAIHYRVRKDGKDDTLSRKLLFDNPIIGGSANRVVRNHAGSEIEKHLPTSSRGDSLIYILSAPGSYARIRIPALEQFRQQKGNVMLHLAELIAEEVPDGNPASNFLTPPDYLYMDFRDTINTVQSPFLTDAIGSAGYAPNLFGGTAKIVAAPPGKGYTRYGIYITRYVQNLITRNSPNFGFNLYAPYNVSYPNLLLGFNVNQLAKGRVRLGGGNHSARPMRLRLLYTRL